jgi:hypothetical protein
VAKVSSHTVIYKGELAKIYDIFPDSMYYNSFYRVKRGRYVFENQKGYIHMIKVVKLYYNHGDGQRELKGYTLSESMLNSKGQWKEIDFNSNTFETEEQAIEFIESGDNYAGEAMQIM